MDLLLVEENAVCFRAFADDVDATETGTVTLSEFKSPSAPVNRIKKQQERQMSKDREARGIMMKLKNSKPVDSQLPNGKIETYHIVDTSYGQGRCYYMRGGQQCGHMFEAHDGYLRYDRGQQYRRKPIAIAVLYEYLGEAVNQKDSGYSFLIRCSQIKTQQYRHCHP